MSPLHEIELHVVHLLQVFFRKFDKIFKKRLKQKIVPYCVTDFDNVR